MPEDTFPAAAGARTHTHTHTGFPSHKGRRALPRWHCACRPASGAEGNLPVMIIYK